MATNKLVVIIAIDGINYSNLFKLFYCKNNINIFLEGIGRNLNNVMYINSLIDSAASSLNVSAVLPTDSAENWCSILTSVLPESID